MTFVAKSVINEARRDVNEPDFGWATEKDFVSWLNTALSEICIHCKPFVLTEKIVPDEEDGLYYLPSGVIEINDVRLESEHIKHHSKERVNYGEKRIPSYNIKNIQSDVSIMEFNSGFEEPVLIEYQAVHPQIVSMDDYIFLPAYYKPSLVSFLVSRYSFKEMNPQLWSAKKQEWIESIMNLKRIEQKKKYPNGSKAINKLRRR